MDTKKIRQKILDLAIHGKLVPQDPNDEPASVLLERIRAEKERLIAEGKIKRSKKSCANREQSQACLNSAEMQPRLAEGKSATSDTSHYENVPFEVPDGWCWCQLEDYFELLSGQDFPPEKYNDAQKGIPYIIGASNINNEKIVINRWTQTPSVKTTKGDLLVVCKGAGVGKMALNDIGEMHIARQIQAIRDVSQLMSIEYIKMVVSYYIEDIIADANGLIPGLKRELLLSLLMPIPPLQEQKRIIATYEQLMSFIENIDNESSEVLHTIKIAKSKILDLAIHGKLVPQDASDEPAAELLKRINPKAVASCDNPQYEQIPDGWCVCTLEDIVDYEQPQAYIVHSTDYSDSYKIPVLTAGKSFIIGYTNEQDGICDNVPVIIFDDFTTDSKYVDFAFKVKSSAMKILHVKDGINIKYVAYFMSITRLIGDTHKRYWISEYSKVNMPLPPKAEQDRIVTQIERLMRSLDSIAETLV